MTHDQASLLSVPDAGERSGFLTRLPKNVRLVGKTSDLGLYEFEVVAGNAAYCEGEHFYLTADQARCAYILPRSTGERVMHSDQIIHHRRDFVAMPKPQTASSAFFS